MLTSAPPLETRRAFRAGAPSLKDYIEKWSLKDDIEKYNRRRRSTSRSSGSFSSDRPSEGLACRRSRALAKPWAMRCDGKASPGSNQVDR